MFTINAYDYRFDFYYMTNYTFFSFTFTKISYITKKII